jgi:iron(III) transport system permease protein
MSTDTPAPAALPELSANRLVARSPRLVAAWRRGLARDAVMIAAAIVALFALVPAGFIAVAGIEAGWQDALRLIIRPRVGALLVNTALLELIAVPLAVTVAVAAAWLTERSDLPGRRLFSWLSIAPLAVPAFVQGYAWTGLVPGLNGLGAAVLISLLSYYPFVYLAVVAQLASLDGSAEEIAAALGQSGHAVFLRVTLPQLRLSILAGGLIVGLHLLGEYGLFAMIRFDTFTTAIFDQFQSAYDSPAANMLAGVLIALCLMLLAGDVLGRGRERYARVGSGAPRRSRRVRLGLMTLPCLAGLAAVGALALGVPLWTLSGWLWAGGLAAWRAQGLAPALVETMALAVGGALATTLAALPMAWLSVRAPGRLQRLLEGCHTYVGALPGVVVALAMVTVTVHFALPLYQTVITLIAAYLLLFLPLAVLGMRGSIAQVPVELELAAMALGKPPLRAVWQITLRLAAPGIAASLALVGLGITTELTATLMLAPNGTSTLATRFWALTGEIDYVAAAPYAVLMIVLSLPLIWLLHARSSGSAGW